MAITIDELLVGLGFDYEPEELEKFKSGVSQTTDIVKSFIKVAAAGAAAINGMVIASTRGTDETGKFANEIGESVGEVDALSFALRRAGGSSDGMFSSLRDLSKVSSEAARGIGEGVEAFGILGVQATDSNGRIKGSAQLIKEISGAMQGLSRQRQIELAQKLGLGESIRLLQQGPAEIQSLINEANALGVATEEDAAAAAQFQDSLTDLWQITKSISRTLSTILVPILDEFNQNVREWWKNNREIIEQNMTGWIDSLTRAVKILTIAFGLLLGAKIVADFIALNKLIKGASLATLALNASALALPVLIAAALAAMTLLIQDAKVFFEGGDSFFGRMIDKFPGLRNEIENTAIVFRTIGDVIGSIVDGWAELIKLFKENDIKELAGDFFGFSIDATARMLGLRPENEQPATIGAGQISSNQNIDSRRWSTKIDSLSISVDGSRSPEETAGAIEKMLRGASEDLSSPVDQ